MISLLPKRLVGAAAFAWLAYARAATADDSNVRSPMPEPLFTETATDIDAREPWECEYELNAIHLRARRGGAYALEGSLELECLVTRRLGVRVEPGYGRRVDVAGAVMQSEAGVSAAASWKVLQDFKRDFHLQLETAARVPWSTTAIVTPGDSALPLVFDLRSGLRCGFLTVRSSVGVAAGGTPEHVPLRAGLALLTGFGASERAGFWGFELDIDGSRPTPAVAALNVSPNLAGLGLPVRLGLGIPYAIGVASDRPAFGIFVRLLFESEREVAYAEKKKTIR